MAKAKVKRPTRDEFELEELGERLVEAHHEDSLIQLTVWGMEQSVRGRIVGMDSRTKLVHVQQDDGLIAKIPFMDIMKVGSSA